MSSRNRHTETAVQLKVALKKRLRTRSLLPPPPEFPRLSLCARMVGCPYDTPLHCTAARTNPNLLASVAGALLSNDRTANRIHSNRRHTHTHMSWPRDGRAPLPRQQAGIVPSEPVEQSFYHRSFRFPSGQEGFSPEAIPSGQSGNYRSGFGLSYVFCLLLVFSVFLSSSSSSSSSSLFVSSWFTIRGPCIVHCIAALRKALWYG